METHNLLVGDHAKGTKRPSGDYLPLAAVRRTGRLGPREVLGPENARDVNGQAGSKVQPPDEVDDFGFNTTSPPVKPPWILGTLCQGGSPEEQVAETSRPLKARSKARLKAAIVYSLTTIIPFLVLLYIIHVGVLSGGRVNVAWVSCLALVALAIALLGGKLLKEAWAKLTHAVETIEDLRRDSPPLDEALQVKDLDDEIDRIPFVVNHLAEIARHQRIELEGYRMQVETLSKRIVETDKEVQGFNQEDPTTTLFNLSCFDDRAGHEVARTKRYQRSLSLALIEVDSFKRFARTAGPQEAQKALSAIGTLIRKMIRETDLPFRFGDSQFAIVFPETTAENATHALKRIRAAVEARNLTAKNSEPHTRLTLSIGVSTLEKEYPNLEQFVSAADGALRKAVASGGNCIVVS